jgi:hypothetical protein
LARDIHSSTAWPDWLMVRDFSMAAESPNSVAAVRRVLASGESGFEGEYKPFRMTAIFLPCWAERI